MSTPCPFCSGTGHAPEVVVNLTHNLLCYAGKIIHLAPREAELLHLITTHKDLTRSKLEQKLFGTRYYDMSHSTYNISVLVYRIRRKRNPLGLTLKNLRPLGANQAIYALTAKEAPK